MYTVGTVIIGGGISGATALYRLAQLGENVLLLERGERLGGVAQSFRTQEGALIERGPNSLQIASGTIDRLIDELDLRDQVVEASALASNRYVLRGGTLVSIPGSPKGLIETPLLSLPAKLRLLAEPLAGKKKGTGDESLADFIRRRLGREVLDYGVNPFVSGIYAGRPENLSVRYAFPAFYAMEQEHGGLLRGMINRARARKRSGAPRPPRRKMISFREGLSTLPAGIHSRWSGNVMTGADVTGIERSAQGWRVNVAGEESVIADRLIVATNAPAAADLLGRVDGDLSKVLRTIVYPPIAVVTLLFERRDVGHPLDGFGLLVPEVERRNVLGVIFSSSVYPTRAPEGKVLLTTFVGGARSPELALLPEDEIVNLVVNDLRSLLGVGAMPVASNVSMWRNSIPQYNVGYGEILEAIDRAESRHDGLHLLGSYRGGVSFGECAESGWTLADRLAGRER